jgi:hypothetical protein
MRSDILLTLSEKSRLVFLLSSSIKSAFSHGRKGWPVRYIVISALLSQLSIVQAELTWSDIEAVGPMT